MNTRTTGTTGTLLHNLRVPQLGDVSYGQGINDLVNNINENFQKIVSSEFLRGPEGKSISLHKYPVTSDPDNNGNTYAVEIFNAVISDIEQSAYAGLDSSSVIGSNVDEGGELIIPEISLIYETVGSEETLISSLPFVYIDPRFSNLNSGIDFTDIEDCSCIVQYSDGAFKKVQTFPTLYYDVNEGQFCWKLNGVNTGLIARGPKGEPGNNGHIYVMEVDDDVDTGVSNKYKVNPFITEDNNVIENVNNGDFAFVAKLENVYEADGSPLLDDSGNAVKEYKYYIGLLKIEDDGVFAILNGNSIYDQFTGVNFNEFLKQINIDGDEYPKGLFIPIDDDCQSAHIICANALSNINNNGNNNKLNMNILPVASLNAMSSNNVQVIRSVGLLFTPKHTSCDIDNPDVIREVDFDTRITSKTTLLQLFKTNEVLDIIVESTGIGYENIEAAPESINIYYFKNTSGNIHVFSRNLNIYDDDLFIIDQSKGEDKTFYSDTDFDVIFKYNHTYLKDITDSNNRVENTSLNFGYESINIGVDDIGSGADSVKRRSTLNVKGDIICTSAVRSEMIKSNTAEIDSLKGVGEYGNINISRPIMTDASLIGENTKADNIAFGKNLLINSNGISGESITIDADEINIMSKSRNNSELNISIPSNITNDINVNIGDNNLYVTGDTVENYQWPKTSDTTSSLTRSMSNGGSIDGASNTSSKWRTSTGTAERTYTLTYKNFPIEDVTQNKIEFKPIIVSFSYQGRSYVWGTTACPRFPYGVRNLSVQYYTSQSGTEVLEKKYELSSYEFGTQIRFTNGNGGDYFANSSSGTSYTDYITIKIPPYTTQKPLTKVVVTFNAYIYGNNGTGHYTTAGDVYLNRLMTGPNYITGGSAITATRSSSVSTGSYFMRVATTKRKGVSRTVICSDGILIGTGSEKRSWLRWDNTAGCLELKNVKTVN